MGLSEDVVDVIGILAVLASELGVAGKADDIDADGGVAELTVADGRARLLVLLAETEPQFVAATGCPVSGIAWGGEVEAGEPSFVFGDRGICVIPRLATDADEVFLQFADRPREGSPACPDPAG